MPNNNEERYLQLAERLAAALESRNEVEKIDAEARRLLAEAQLRAHENIASALDRGTSSPHQADRGTAGAVPTEAAE